MKLDDLPLNIIYVDLIKIYETHNLLLERVDKLEKQLDKNKEYWISVSEVARVKGLTNDAVRKQLQGGQFEPEVDFKYIGNKIVVQQGVVERIQRKRRNSTDG